ncbi:MAG: bifunctional riboflavin kinase/FAD synthetase [Chloroflexota bacterium]
MTHVQSLDSITLVNSWLTIGIFDGVHRGHQSLLDRLVTGAQAEGNPAVVLTFHPHPAIVLGNQGDFKFLTTPQERAEILESLGVEVVITQPFDRQLAAQSAETFMRHLSRTLGVERLIIGYDFALGRGREGDSQFLTTLGKSLGYSVDLISPVSDDTEIISSSRIRQHLAAGQVEQAALDLGRLYSLQGPVVHGDGRGRHINIPTANIEIPEGKIVPGNGVYACWARDGAQRHAAVTNVGIRPTFTPEKQSVNVEAHLLNFERDLYGREVQLEFVARLRDEMKFPSVDALITQIQADIARAHDFLA